MTKQHVVLSLALLAGLGCAGSLLAQPWERAYGPQFSFDEGHRRVTPVARCPGRGYIAIGTRDLGAISQVYLVRTNNAGATLWENYFDVGADGEPDQGFSLVELRDGSGFATTGSSQRGGVEQVHALKVDCGGNLVRSFIYPAPISIFVIRSVGHDIREATVGNGTTTQPGDLLIAGDLDFGGQEDGLLMRITAGFNLVWNIHYDTGVTERFNGLTEARANVTGGGDVIAVGESRNPLGLPSQALAIRVDGNSGLMTGGFHCMATYGDVVGDENLQSVIEMRLTPSTGNLTMAGLSNSPGQRDDVYLVQTGPNPCVLLNQTTSGNSGGAFEDYATDLIEVLAQVDPTLGVPLGSLALTGYAETANSIGDAFLMFADPILLTPIAAFRYGDHRGAVDFGTSLAQLPNSPFPPTQPRGFIIAGTTFTDWAGAGDPEDLYLVQPNNAAKTGCEEKWKPESQEWPWEVRRPGPRYFRLLEQEEVHTLPFHDDTVVRACN